MFGTQLHERDPFRAIFAYGGTLSGLDPKQVRGIDPARGDVRKFANEVVRRLEELTNKAKVA
jgi:chromosome partitioning protein